MVKITSDGMVTPGTYVAGSGTTRVSEVDDTRENLTASVEVSALGLLPGSSAGCSSVCEYTRRVGVRASTVMCLRTSMPGSNIASWCAKNAVTGSGPRAVATASVTSPG